MRLDYASLGACKSSSNQEGEETNGTPKVDFGRTAKGREGRNSLAQNTRAIEARAAEACKRTKKTFGEAVI